MSKYVDPTEFKGWLLYLLLQKKPFDGVSSNNIHEKLAGSPHLPSSACNEFIA